MVIANEGIFMHEKINNEIKVICFIILFGYYAIINKLNIKMQKVALIFISISFFSSKVRVLLYASLSIFAIMSSSVWLWTTKMSSIYLCGWNIRLLFLPLFEECMHSRYDKVRSAKTEPALPSCGTPTRCLKMMLPFLQYLLVDT